MIEDLKIHAIGCSERFSVAGESCYPAKDVIIIKEALEKWGRGKQAALCSCVSEYSLQNAL